MKVPGIEGNYIMKLSNYFGVRDPKSGKAKISKEKRNEISKDIIEFMKNYKKWFTIADERLKDAVLDGKVKRSSYETFIERQVKIAEDIKYIFDKALTGDVYFNFKEFEKQNMKDYASKRVFNEFEEMAFQAKQLENTMNSDNIKTQNTADENYASVEESDEKAVCDCLSCISLDNHQNHGGQEQ